MFKANTQPCILFNDSKFEVGTLSLLSRRHRLTWSGTWLLAASTDRVATWWNRKSRLPSNFNRVSMNKLWWLLHSSDKYSLTEDLFFWITVMDVWQIDSPVILRLNTYHAQHFSSTHRRLDTFTAHDLNIPIFIHHSTNKRQNPKSCRHPKSQEIHTMSKSHV